ncbi:hypothetical protein COV12_01580 [Candidatus Woesearchaeota archaeon CG10_big_fil_rev_8_21_14_0_10_32_24]|nr:MAG: hypothetical protein COV12_01580 [Candidatus Woesearchaeota archaeon CG10_big_fil_rev_8_21_14_0_10_32_24]
MFGGKGYGIAKSIQQTTDLGYIVTGYTWLKGGGDFDAWIFKLNNNGSLEWEKTFGGNKDDRLYSIQQTTDLGYIVAGYTDSKGAGDDGAWILKLDTKGKLEWDKTFGGTKWGKATSIQQTKDLGYIVAGFTNSKGAEKDNGWIFKLNSKGDLQWEKIYGGSKNGKANSILQTAEGKYVLAGYTNSKGMEEYDVWILKLDEKGELCE